MSWERHLIEMFDDLSGQADAALGAERAWEVAEQARAEYGSVTLASRLMASVGSVVTLRVAGVGALSGELLRCTASWCLLGAAGREWLVALPALLSIGGVAPRSVPEQAWPASARLGLASALRGLSDAAEPARVHLVDGARLDVTWGRVGNDFVEVFQGEPVQLTLLAHSAIAAVAH